MEAPDTTSRFFPSHVLMPDGSFAQPLIQIEFFYGRDGMMDTSGANAIRILVEPILNTNRILDLEHNVNVPASTIYEILSRHFIAKMGTCEQIRTRWAAARCAAACWLRAVPGRGGAWSAVASPRSSSRLLFFG